MKQFDLKIGYSCNNDCIHCVVAEKRKLVKKVSFDEIINSIPPDVDEVVVTGGEPTIRKDFFDILRAIKKKLPKARILLQTNGRFLKDKEFCRKTSQYVYTALIAIHSHDAAIHDSITQRKGSWQDTVDGIKNALRYIKNVISQTVISKLNCNNLPETYDFIFQQLGVKKANLTFPHPNGNALTYFDQVVPRYHEIKYFIDQVIVKYKDKVMVEAIPLCYIHPLVNEVFVYRYTTETGGYDKSLRRNIVEDYRKLILSEQKKIPACKKCMYNNDCIGVWKEYFLHPQVDLRPIKVPFDFPITTIFTNKQDLIKLLNRMPEFLRYNLIVFYSNKEYDNFCKEISDKYFIKCIFIHLKKNLIKAAFQFKKVIFIKQDFDNFESIFDPAQMETKMGVHKNKKAIMVNGASFSELRRFIDVYRFISADD